MSATDNTTPAPKIAAAQPPVNLMTSTVTSLRFFMKDHPFQSVLGK